MNLIFQYFLVFFLVSVFFKERFTKVLLEQQQDRAKREQERIRLMTADPFDLEAQAKIEEEIRCCSFLLISSKRPSSW